MSILSDASTFFGGGVVEVLSRTISSLAFDLVDVSLFPSLLPQFSLYIVYCVLCAVVSCRLKLAAHSHVQSSGLECALAQH